MKWFAYSTGVIFLLLLLGPLYMAASGSDQARARSWRFADRTSAGIAPAPEHTPEAVIQVYAARAWSWRGNLAVHTWISTKEEDAAFYTVHQVVGFRVRRGLPALESEPGAPDRNWYGNRPDLLVDIRGEAARALIPKVLEAVRSYPYPDEYTLWPGPNSNTFTAHVGRAVPELGLVLPVTAIGKDYLPGGALFGSAPSGTGYQLSLWGALGVTLALQEGLELNILGLALGIDFAQPALKLPGIGRLGLSRSIEITPSTTGARFP